jgi:hypothetical protein
MYKKLAEDFGQISLLLCEFEVWCRVSDQAARREIVNSTEITLTLKP